MDAAKEKLYRVLDTALQSEDIDLRDNVVSYIGLIEDPYFLPLLQEHIAHEEVEWLKSYAVKVIEYLKAREAGVEPLPPGESDPEDTLVKNVARWRKTMRGIGDK